MVSLYGTHAASEHCDVVNALFVLLVYNVSIIHRTMNLYIIQCGYVGVLLIDCDFYEIERELKIKVQNH